MKNFYYCRCFKRNLILNLTGLIGTTKITAWSMWFVSNWRRRVLTLCRFLNLLSGIQRAGFEVDRPTISLLLLPKMTKTHLPDDERVILAGEADDMTRKDRGIECIIVWGDGAPAILKQCAPQESRIFMSAYHKLIWMISSRYRSSRRAVMCAVKASWFSILTCRVSGGRYSPGVKSANINNNW